MILFLDFDGVLHPNRDGAEHFCCAPLLWELLRQQPEVSVVFSTSWRFECSLDELRGFVCTGGGEDLAERFIGTTPLLRHTQEAGSREKDCRAWLMEHNLTHAPWLALDDMPQLFRDAGRVYAINPKQGLMYYDLARISAKLQKAKP